MTTLESTLPADRTRPGELRVVGDGAPSATDPAASGPWRCLGKADNQSAAQHGNPARDPTLPFGDHPTGDYALVAIHRFDEASSKYGPGWISLDPTGGDALTAERNGRFGLLIHGGRLRDGALRPTFGCLRVDNATVRALLELWDAGTIGPGTVYRCATDE